MADVSEKVGQDLGKIIEVAIQIVEERLMHDDSKEAMLAKVFMQENAAGKKTEYKLVSKEFAKDLKKLLCERDIPFISTETSTGDTLFLCTEDHTAEFYLAQKDVFSLSTTMSRECTATKMAEIAAHSTDKRVVTVSFTDERMAMIAQQELYENDVVCSMNNFYEESVPGEPDLNARMYISTSSVYASYKSHHDFAHDLASAELKLAIIQTMGDVNPEILDTRKKQAAYDRSVLEDFTMVVASKQGEMYLADDEKLGNGKYLYVKDGAVAVYQRVNGKLVHDDIHIASDATLSEIRATISRQGMSIRNKATFGGQSFDKAHPVDRENGRNAGGRPVARKEISKDVRDKMYELVDLVSREASAYVDEKHPYKSNTEKYELKKKRMAELMNKMISTKEIIDKRFDPSFLEAKVMDLPSSPTVAEYLKAAVAHFEDTHEKSNDEITVDVEVVTKKLTDRIKMEESLDRDRISKGFVARNDDRDKDKDKDKDEKGDRTDD